MPRSHKPRKRYIPKRIDCDPIDLAISRATVLTIGQRTLLTAPMHKSLEAFRTGKATRHDWANLADAMNVAEQLSALHIASDHGETWERAQATLAAVHDRVAAGGSFTLRGPELSALDDAVFVHGVQLEHCSQAELEQAILRVKRRVEGALQGNVGPGTRVLNAGGLGVGA